MNNDSDYDCHKYHDNVVHGIRFLVEEFVSEIVLDIDYIVLWPVEACDEVNKPIFRVARCDLRFTDVTDLKVDVDWGESGYTTAVAGTSIDRIDRHLVATTLRVPAYYHWNVVMNDGRSRVSFGASSMLPEIKGESIEVPRQYLNDSERDR